jgi:16S rRNA (cytosine1407-C5)-methyltransferase
MNLRKRHEPLIEPTDIQPVIRVNPSRGDPEETLQSLESVGISCKKIPWLPNAYWYDAPFSISATQAYLTGRIYRQGAASQLPVTYIEDEDPDIILDACAAPGSKTTQLAERFPNTQIIATDVNNAKLKSVQNHVSRSKYENVETHKLDARYLDDLPYTYDVILLDAPCSGNHTQTKAFYEERTMEDIESRTLLQQQLLDSAYAALRPGGTLLYSTCTLEPSENEGQIHEFIQYYTEMHVSPIQPRIGSNGLTSFKDNAYDDSLRGTVRVNGGETEPFYIAKLRKE